MISSLEFSIAGMHCASCASKLESHLHNQKGVSQASVNLATEVAFLQFDPELSSPEQLAHAVSEVGFRVRPPEESSPDAMETATEQRLSREKRKVLLCGILAAILMLLSMLPMLNIPYPIGIGNLWNGLLLLLTLPVLFWGGKDIFRGAWGAFLHRQFNMNTLIALGTSAAVLLSLWITLFPHTSGSHEGPTPVYYDSAAMIITLVLLGRWLEGRARGQTNEAVRQLWRLQPESASVLRDGVEQRTPIQEILPGDILRIRPGERIAVDGLLLEGSSSLDESMITGEPLPKDKTIGDRITAGTINLQGTFLMKTERVGQATMLAHMVRLVREAQGSKVPIQLLADRIAGKFVPAVLATALVTLVAGWQWGPSFSFALINAVSVLVIACPCAMGLATPTAIVAGMGRGAQAGILIRNGTALQNAERVEMILLDKTGTLSSGRPQVIQVESLGPRPEAEWLPYLQAAEKGSEHPLSYALLAYTRPLAIPDLPLQDFQAAGGFGIRARVQGKTVLAGNRRWMEENGISTSACRWETVPAALAGATVVLLAIDGEPVGRCFIADPLRPEAPETIASLHRLGLKTILLSGDREMAAREAAEKLGIEKVIAEILPEGKIEEVRRLQAEGHRVAMAGDGINDAPALSQADIGIAIGTGSDIAIHAADITLVGGDIRGIARSLRLSRLTMRIIRQNLFWAFLYNIVCIPLASGLLYGYTGWRLNPMWASAAMAFSSVSVVSNSLRLKRVSLDE